MVGVEKEDWNELVRILKETEENITALNGGDCGPEIERSRRSLQAFHTTAAMLGLNELEKAGLELEKYLDTEVNSASTDTLAAFGFAVNLLADQMHGLENGEAGGSIDTAEIMELLKPQGNGKAASILLPDEIPEGWPAQVEAGGEEVGANEQCLDDAGSYSRLTELVKSLGGELSFSSDGSAGKMFHITLTGSSETLRKLNTLLVPGGSSAASAPEAQDTKLEKIMDKGREFMDALSNGDMVHAQEILVGLADQQLSDQQPAGLYKEIGSLARGLHDSIRNFINIMDPSIKEIVEEKIPDSGNRLEHMLQLTEKAAITTMDNVEEMQERIGKEITSLSRLRELVGGLMPIGDQSEKKLEECTQILGGLEEIVSQHRHNLDAILTAQDFQDLSGQIIIKITNLLEDLERKLVNVIRTFGVKTETVKKSGDTLYGPAHAARDDAVHSQDEVDSLLAEFGF